MPDRSGSENTPFAMGNNADHMVKNNLLGLSLAKQTADQRRSRGPIKRFSSIA